MPPPRLQVYLLRSPRLSTRGTSSADVVGTVRAAAEKAGWECESAAVTELDGDSLRVEDHTGVLDPSPATGEPAFQSQLGGLTRPQLSNLLRHRDIARRASESDATLSLVLEDDVLRTASTEALVTRFLQAFTRNAFVADIVFCGLPRVTPEGHVHPDSLTLKDAALDDVELLRFQSAYLVAPSKDSYFLTPTGAAALWSHWKEKVSFRTNVQLSWTIKARDMRAFFFSRNLFIDGSKFGFFANSCAPNGHLIYNASYMDSLRLLQKPGRSPADLDKAERLVDALAAQFRNPAVLHNKGIIVYLRGDAARAHAVLLEAFDLALQEGACLNHTSELLNNAINLCKFVQ